MPDHSQVTAVQQNICLWKGFTEGDIVSIFVGCRIVSVGDDEKARFDLGCCGHGVNFELAVEWGSERRSDEAWEACGVVWRRAQDISERGVFGCHLSDTYITKGTLCEY